MLQVLHLSTEQVENGANGNFHSLLTCSCSSCCSAKLDTYNMLIQRLLRLVSPHYSLARGIYNISQARACP